MSIVVMHAVTSLDGYIADADDQVGPLFDWYFTGNQPLQADPEQQHPDFRVSAASATFVRSFVRSGTASRSPCRDGTCST